MRLITVSLVVASLALFGCDRQESSTTTDDMNSPTTEIETSSTPDTDSVTDMSTTSTM